MGPGGVRDKVHRIKDDVFAEEVLSSGKRRIHPLSAPASSLQGFRGDLHSLTSFIQSLNVKITELSGRGTSEP